MAIKDGTPMAKVRQENGFLVSNDDHLDMNDYQRSRRPFDYDKDYLNALIRDAPPQSTWKLASMTIVWHLHFMGKVGCRNIYAT